MVDRRVHRRPQGQQAGRREVPRQHRKWLEARLLRRQPGLSAAPDAGAAAAGQARRQDRLSRGARAGARRYPVGQVAVGRGGDRRIGGRRTSRSATWPPARRRWRPGLVGAGRRAPGPPALALVDGRKSDVATQLRVRYRDCRRWSTTSAAGWSRRWTGATRGPRGVGEPPTSTTWSTPSAHSAAPLALVSPEVGLTVVPATESGRRFADELGSAQPAPGRAVRPCGAGGRRPAADGQGDNRDGIAGADFEVIPPDRRGGRGRRAGPPGHADQAARLAGPARGPVGVGVGMPGGVPAAAVRARPGRGLRRRPRRHRAPGCRRSRPR